MLRPLLFCEEDAEWNPAHSAGDTLYSHVWSALSSRGPRSLVMKCVRFGISIPSFLLVKSIGRWADWPVMGRLSGLSIAEMERPPLPASDWVGLDLIACGVCGSDVSTLWFSHSTALEPFNSFPAVLGHEILARVSELGSDVSGLELGQRVVVDPFIGCAARGQDACPSCASGWHATCGRMGDSVGHPIGGEPMAPGMLLGAHRQLPGGWAERMVAHRQHVFPVPDEVPDRAAVLTEPLSIAMHAVLQSGHQDSPILVIGSGTIAMSVVWALRATGFEGEILVQAKRDHEAEHAMALGATRVLRPGDEARSALLSTGARAYKPLVGPEVYGGGGYSLIFDCVGSGSSIAQSLAYAAPRAKVVLLGCAASLGDLDLSPLWSRELCVDGYVGYGIESDGRHTYEHTLEALAKDSTVARLVTHVFSLSDAVDGLRAAANHRESHALKVLLAPDPSAISE